MQNYHDYVRLTLMGEWTPELHGDFPVTLRRAVRTLLLVMQRGESCAGGSGLCASYADEDEWRLSRPFPKVALMLVIQHAAWPLSTWSQMAELESHAFSGGSPFDMIFPSMPPTS